MMMEKVRLTFQWICWLQCCHKFWCLHHFLTSLVCFRLQTSSGGSIGAGKVDFLLPPLKPRQAPGRDDSRSHNVPIYVKHGYPEVFRNKTDYYNYLPKIPQLPGPEAEETYGLMYHKPETEAEIKMHDLWIARRRQEVIAKRFPIEEFHQMNSN